jgi:site-specific DNA recombinase
MRAAIYARVSTERQGREQTIDSQLGALRRWADEQRHELPPEHVYTDEGFTGARLDRPGLDALRDAVQLGVVEVVAVLSPDRLARKYAYQVLLLEELRKAGCEVVFLHRPITDDPQDQLLLQIQGAVAEYERAVIGERFRRGKLQKAREGHWLGGKAPYGYRYIPKRDGVPGYLVVDEDEAALVRQLFTWLVDERMTIRQIVKRLNEGPWWPRSGRHPWQPSVVHRILYDETYAGMAHANRYRFVPPKKPRAPAPGRGENRSRQPRPREEWIGIPVPALIDREAYHRAQEQLARNAALSFRNNTRHSYLLRCLLTCQTCGLRMFGVTPTSPPERSIPRYYRCSGKDCTSSAREHRCPQRMTPAEGLEAAVWGHIQQLLGDPETLLAQFRDMAEHGEGGGARPQSEADKLEAQIGRMERESGRLIDAYQAGIIGLDELDQRRRRLAERRLALAEQHEQQLRLMRESARAQEVLGDLTTFCERIRSRLDGASFAEKQEVLQLLIERVIVGEETLEIRHVIRLRGLPPGGSGSEPPDCGLRPDGVVATALHRRPVAERQVDRLPQRLRAVDHEQPPPHGAEATPDQVLQQRLGHHGVLRGPFAQAQDVLVTVGVDAHGADHVVRAELQPVDPDGQDVELREIAFGEPLEQAFAGLDRLARDLAPGDADGLGHRGDHRLVASGRDARAQDLEHPIGQAAVLADGLVGGDLDLPGLSGLGVLATEPRLVDAEFPLLEWDTPLLGTVVDDVAVGRLALLLGSGDPGGAHQQDGLDGGAAHDVDQVVDGALGVLDQVEHG